MTMHVEAGLPVVVKEPAAPSLLADIVGGSGSENDVDTVEFKNWSKIVIDMALMVSRKVVVVYGGVHVMRSKYVSCKEDEDSRLGMYGGVLLTLILTLNPNPNPTLPTGYTHDSCICYPLPLIQ